MEGKDMQQQEYAFIMEGITTRMQIALEKMSESNRMMSDTNKRLCETIKHHNIMIIVVVLIVVLGFIVNNMVWMGRDNGTGKNVSGEVVTNAGEESLEGLRQLGP